MLDDFSTDNADDYIAGFPAHPHRGFETVTYMLDGHMRHEDHLGTRGDLKSGGVQWMTAGRGIIHSEMPQQEQGRMRGFQLWINLPAREKMKPAAYRDIPAGRNPGRCALPGAGAPRSSRGRSRVGRRDDAGPDPGAHHRSAVPRRRLAGGREVRATRFTPDTTRSSIRSKGSVDVGEPGASRTLATHHAGVLSDGDGVDVTAGADGARFLLLAGRPLREPIVQYGPFVMNTREEIEQAIRDYQNGELTRAAA